MLDIVHQNRAPRDATSARYFTLTSIAVLAVMTLVVTACGVNYGWVQDFNGNHATCGQERAYIVDSDGTAPDYPKFQAWAWKELTADGPCNRNDSAGYQSGPGHLGLRIIGYKNGVVCVDWGLGTNPTSRLVYEDSSLCIDFEAGQQQYWGTIQYRWWAQVPNAYAGVQRNTPTVTT